MVYKIDNRKQQQITIKSKTIAFYRIGKQTKQKVLMLFTKKSDKKQTKQKVLMLFTKIGDKNEQENEKEG